MTFNEIYEELDELRDEPISEYSDSELDESVDRLKELADHLEEMAEDEELEDDTEYQETKELLEEVQYLINAECDSEDFTAEY